MTLTPRTHEAGRSRLVAYDLGATLATWEVDGRPVVWLSREARLDGTKGLRGGIPLCFPWFASGPRGDLSPNHGPARTATWEALEPAEDELWAWGLSSESLREAPGAEHLPGPFEARYAVRLPASDAPAVLEVELELRNPGAESFPVEVALHTYLAVADVRSAAVLGLDGVPYYDKVTRTRGVQQGPVSFTGETDLVLDSPGEPGVRLETGDGGVVELLPHGSTQTVVWNPWVDKAAETEDLGDEEWQDFVCIETAATGGRALSLPACGSVRIGCRFTVHPPVTA